jgi:hypothetical protein
MAVIKMDENNMLYKYPFKQTIVKNSSKSFRRYCEFVIQNSKDILFDSLEPTLYIEDIFLWKIFPFDEEKLVKVEKNLVLDKRTRELYFIYYPLE